MNFPGLGTCHFCFALTFLGLLVALLVACSFCLGVTAISVTGQVCISTLSFSGVCHTTTVLHGQQ